MNNIKCPKSKAAESVSVTFLKKRAGVGVTRKQADYDSGFFFLDLLSTFLWDYRLLYTFIDFIVIIDFYILL